MKVGNMTIKEKDGKYDIYCGNEFLQSVEDRLQIVPVAIMLNHLFEMGYKRGRQELKEENEYHYM